MGKSLIMGFLCEISSSKQKKQRNPTYERKMSMYKKIEIEVNVPDEHNNNQIDYLYYLVKVVDIKDPMYEYILGLASYYTSYHGLYEKQMYLLDKLIAHYKNQGVCE